MADQGMARPMEPRGTSIWLRLLITGGALFALLLLAPSVTLAATFTPDPAATDAVDANPGNGVCADASGTCTLRAAVMEANALSGADTIELPPGTYTLSIPGVGEEDSRTGDLDVLGDLTIIGTSGNPADTIIRAGTNAYDGIDRVISVNPLWDRAINFTLQNVTIQYGRNTYTLGTGYYGAGLDYDGGSSLAPALQGTLTIENSVITDNHSLNEEGGGLSVFTAKSVTITDTVISNNKAAKGGGIRNYAGALTVSRSTISGNEAYTQGGGVYSTTTDPAVLTVVNSTISGNHSNQDGGGVWLSSGVTTKLTNVTITGNVADFDGNGGCNSSAGGNCGGGIFTNGNANTVELKNSIVALNYRVTSTTDDIAQISAATYGSNNLIGVDPGFDGGLANHGGRTPTYALLATSPAIDAGTDAGLTTDQRGAGYARKADHISDADTTDAVDIGAFELNPSIADIPNQPNASIALAIPFAIATGDDSRAVLTATSSDTSVVPNANLTFTPSTPPSSQTLHITALRSGTTTITVQVQACESDGAGGKNCGDTASDSFVLEVTAAPVLTISSHTDSGPFTQGQTGTYTITIENTGDLATAGDITLGSTLSTGLAATSAVGTDWSCPGTGLSCTYSGVLAPGSSTSVTLNVSITDDAPATVSNTAAVTGGSSSAASDPRTTAVNLTALAPQVTQSFTTDEDTPITSGLTITKNASDGAEVTHFKITAIAGGTLRSGGTAISSDSYITLAQGTTGLTFSPAADANDNPGNGGPFGFDVQAAVGTSDTGISSAVSVTIHVTPVNDPPAPLDDALDDLAEGSGTLTIPISELLSNDSAGPADEPQGLTLSLVNGSAVGGTVVLDGDNLLFTLPEDYNGLAGFSYTVADTNGATNTAAVSLTVTEVNDTPTAVDDVLDTLNVAEDDPAFVIAGADLTANDLKGPANEGGQSLTVDTVSGAFGGTATLTGGDVRFTPAANYHGPAGFAYTVRDNGTTNGTPDPLVSVAAANVSFIITPIADRPETVGATTAEDTRSASGLVITRNAVDGNEVTHFLISDISGGTLYKHDGTTVINDGDFITVGEAAPIDGFGLTFKPGANQNSSAGGVFRFAVQGTTSDDPTETASQSPTKYVLISVSEVNDPPTAGETLSDVAEDSPEFAVTLASLLTHGAPGPNEAGQAVSFDGLGTATGGAIRLSDDGLSVIFTPTPDYHGPAGFTYQVVDDGTTDTASDPQTAVATAGFQITPVADEPDVTSATTAEDTQTTTGLVITHNAIDGAEVTHFQITGITGGTLRKHDGSTPINDGDFIEVAEAAEVDGFGLLFAPAGDLNSPDGGSFGFIVQAALDASGTGISAPVPVTITVTEVNDAPTAVADSLTDEGEDAGPWTIPFVSLTANDLKGPANEAGQGLTITAVSNPTGGTVSIVGTDVLFTPTENWNGAAGFSYTVQDNGTTDGADDFRSATGTVSFTIFEVNDPPVGADDALLSVMEDSGTRTIAFSELLTGDLAGPDNESGQTLTITAVSGAVGGTVTISGTDVLFTPAPDFYGTAGFDYTLRDNGTTNGSGDFLTDTAHVSFAITPVADPPTIAPATPAEDTQSDTGLVITRHAADGDEVTHFKISGITNGTLYLHDGVTRISDGSFITATAGGAGLRFTPAANKNSPAGDSFGFTVEAATDASGAGISPGIPASITVTEVNDPPVPADDLLPDVAEDSEAFTVDTSTLLTNDSRGPTDENSQDLTVTLVDNATGGTVSLSGTTITFTPALNFNGPAGFRYTVRDNGTTGGAADPQSATGSVAFTVTPVADAPAVTGATTAEDTQTASGLVITRNAADDTEVTHFKITAITGGTLMKHDGSTVIHDGDFVESAEAAEVDGFGLRFTPDTDKNSPAGDTFGFTVQAATDASGAGISTGVAVAITVTEVNDAPVPVVESIPSIPEDFPSPFLVRSSDMLFQDKPGPANETGQSLMVTAAGNPVGLSPFTFSETEANVHYHVAPDFNGPASFSYTVVDNGTTNGAVDPKSAVGTFVVMITPVNDPPVGADDALASIAEDSGVRTIAASALLANDSAGPADESGQTLTITGVAGAVGGAIRISGLALLFTPAPDFYGTAGFDYTVRDNGTTNGTDDFQTGTAHVSFAVAPVADPPTITPATTAEETQSTSGLVITRNGADGDEVTHFKISSITNGTLYLHDGVTQISEGTLITAAAGGEGLRFTPTVNKNSPAGDSFGFTVQAATDAAGAGISPSVSVAVTVTAVNDPPVPADDILTNVAEDSGPFTVDTSTLLANDSRGPADENGQDLIVTLVDDATGGTVSLSGTTITFTPALNFNGPAGFRYTVRDNGTTNAVADPRTGSGHATFTITPVNDPPVALDGTLTAVAGESRNGTLQATDVDGDSLTYSIVTPPAQGTLSITNATTGAFTFRPTQNGTDSFTFQASDGTANSNTATVSITVNNPPVTPLPPFSVSAPPELTREATVTISGTTGPRLTVRVGNVTTHADAGGSFSATVALKEGSNSITVSDGTRSESFVVVRDSTPPALRLAASVTSTEAETATLTAISEEGATIQIEGQPVSSLTVSLSPGPNRFSATATDRAGNQATAAVMVVRIMPKEKTVIVQPGQPADVITDQLSIHVPAGTTSEPLHLMVRTPGPDEAAEQPRPTAVVAVVAEVMATHESDGTAVHELDESVTLTFTYDPSAVPDPTKLKVYWFNPAAHAWVELGGVLNTTAHTITVTVDHFSWFAVMAPEESTPVLESLPQKVSQESITLNGTGTPGSTITLVNNNVDGASTTVAKNGRFSLTASLAEGPNRLYVKTGGFLASREALVVYTPKQKEEPTTPTEPGTPTEPTRPTEPGTPSEPATPATLIDIDGHWAATAIAEMVRLGVVKGYEDSTFRPGNQVSRLEFAVMVARLLKLDPVAESLLFTDRDQIPAWATGQVAAAVKAGIIRGRADGSFEPGAPVTRAEVAIMLVRALAYKELDVTPGDTAFADSASIPAWALDQVLTAARYGLVTGYEDSTFRPGGFATRAEAVTMLNRLLNALSR